VSAFTGDMKVGLVGQVELLLVPACPPSCSQRQLLLSLALLKVSSQACQTFHLSDMNGCGFPPAQQHSWPPENAIFLFSR